MPSLSILTVSPDSPSRASTSLWGTPTPGTLPPPRALYAAPGADAAPPERAGSLLTLQNALGFLLTAMTVQIAPALAALIGWPWVLAIMSLGPALGIRAMRLLMRG